MRLALRTVALLIAVAGVMDPVLARRTRAPLAIDLRLPAASHPGFARADALRRSLLAELPSDVEVNGARDPQAVVALGEATIAGGGNVPVFALRGETATPKVTIQQFEVPAWSPPGRAVHVSAHIRASNTAGRRTTMSIRIGGAPVASTEYRWPSDDATHVAEFSFAPPAPGAHRISLVARTEGETDAVVSDALINVRDQPLRVLAFDARPTWPVAFARRSLETDAMFEVAALTRSARPVATTAGGAPRRLDGMNADRYDVILAGALDDLTPDDLRALDRFVTERGGTVVLAPDRRMPAAVARQFGLPDAEEVLLERPLAAEDAVAPVRGSELLLLPADERATTIAAVPHAGSLRPVVAAFQRGEGQVVVSGLLDAWRFRGDDNGAFDAFWRSLVADAALAVRPQLDLRLAPAIARPGDTVRIAVQVRQNLLGESGDRVAVGAVEASLTGANGRRESIRLWPGSRAGLFEASVQAPASGAYTVRATHGESAAEVPLLVADDVMHTYTGEGAALRHAAAVSGGAVVASPAEAARAVLALPSATVGREMRPMRSPWWIVPFAGLLCAEWALRRRAGQR